tara:strand:- start:194 stop:640 length:447 start_codon:yes stop_codon:yes gene_type:complete
MDLVLVRGISGAGKSTIADMLNVCAASFSTDDMFYKIPDGVTMPIPTYQFDPSKLSEYHAATVQKVKDVMVDLDYEHTSGEDLLTPRTIIVHNTFTEEWEMQPYFDLAKEFEWRVHTIIVENRHGSKSIHDVPDDVVKAQKERFEVIL